MQIPATYIFPYRALLLESEVLPIVAGAALNAPRTELCHELGIADRNTVTLDHKTVSVAVVHKLLRQAACRRTNHAVRQHLAVIDVARLHIALHILERGIRVLGCRVEVVQVERREDILAAEALAVMLDGNEN